MTAKAKTRTTVGEIDDLVLAFTAGRDAELDHALIDADCIGSAAHVTMLAGLREPLFTGKERDRIIAELVEIIRRAREGGFHITTRDQDVHMAVERTLTRKLGDLGKRIHTGRSRNDQIALDLRLFGKEMLLEVIAAAVALVERLHKLAKRYEHTPMVGRTHLQPAMPSSVGLWAAAHAESLLDDLRLLMTGYELNNQCPLGAAAGYGVPIPLDREKVARLLGFGRPMANVLYAVSARGKIESIILSALSQVMLSLSRLAEDLILYTMPEFGYFSLPPAYCTGSSIMPQKQNPDVLELIRAKTARLAGDAAAVFGIVKGLPSGYNRDVQETKEPYLNGFLAVADSLTVLDLLLAGLKVNRKALRGAFTPGVFATDRAIQLVGEGLPFRDAYQQVKAHLDDLSEADPIAAIAAKTSYGDTGGLPFNLMKDRIKTCRKFVRDERRIYYRAISRLLHVPYPACSR